MKALMHDIISWKQWHVNGQYASFHAGYSILQFWTLLPIILSRCASGVSTPRDSAVYPVADYVTYANYKYCMISTVNDEYCMVLVATI